METETLLAALWAATDADTDDRVIAEQTRKRLFAGDLIPAGNCRDEPRAYWAADEEE